jgi:hypothetical protein
MTWAHATHVSSGITATFGGTAIACISDVTLPSIKADAPIKSTHQTSTSGAHTYVPSTFVDYGEVKIKAETDLGTLPAVNTSASLVITFGQFTPDRIFTCNAIYEGHDLGNGQLGRGFEATLSFKLSGLPVLSDAGV